MKYRQKFNPYLISIFLAAAGFSNVVQAGVHELIHDQKWKEASRALFQEAQSASPLSTYAIKEQAKAGYFDDALAAIDSQQIGIQSESILVLVMDAKAMEPSRAQKLIEKAISLADESRNPTGILTKAALIYAQKGNLARSKAVFEMAMAKASDSYSGISSTMEYVDVGDHLWMVEAVSKALKDQGDLAQSSSTYRDLVKVAKRHGHRELALKLLNSGSRAINRIPEKRMRDLYNKFYDELRLELGVEVAGTTSANGSTNAIKAAREKQYERALGIINSLNSNLYVSHSQAALQAVITDAMARKDIKTAEYFMVHGTQLSSWELSRNWSALGQLQADQGKHPEALKSYDKALTAITSTTRFERTRDDVRALSMLAKQMVQGHHQAQAIKVIDQALIAYEGIPIRRSDDRIKAVIDIAPMLMELGKKDQSKKLLEQAYSYTLVLRNDSVKSSLLSSLGTLMAMMQKN